MKFTITFFLHNFSSINEGDHWSSSLLLLPFSVLFPVSPTSVPSPPPPLLLLFLLTPPPSSSSDLHHQLMTNSSPQTNDVHPKPPPHWLSPGLISFLSIVSVSFFLHILSSFYPRLALALFLGIVLDWQNYKSVSSAVPDSNKLPYLPPFFTIIYIVLCPIHYWNAQIAAALPISSNYIFGTLVLFVCDTEVARAVMKDTAAFGMYAVR